MKHVFIFYIIFLNGASIINKLFVKFVIAIIISYVSMGRLFSMEDNPNHPITESLQLKISKNQTDFDFDFLALLPKEILDEIIKILKHDISFDGLLFCYKNLHKIITKNFAELILCKMYKKLLFEARDLDNLKKITSNKHRSLDKNFPNYDVLNQAYLDCIIDQQNKLDDYCADSLDNLKSAIIRQRRLVFNNNIDIFESKILQLAQDLTAENKLALQSLSLIIKNIKKRLRLEVIWYSITKETFSNPISLMCACTCLLGYIPTLLMLFNNEHGFAIKGEATVGVIALALCLFVIIKYDFIKPITDTTLKTLSELSDKIDNILKDSNRKANIYLKAQ